MTLNEALVQQMFINKLLLKSNDNELDKNLKVKIMTLRIALGKIKLKLDNECKEIIETLKPEGFDELNAKSDKSEEEQEKLNDMLTEINEGYAAFTALKGAEEISLDTKLTEEEYAQIIDVNADNNIEINGASLVAADFLEVIYSLFVE